MFGFLIHPRGGKDLSEDLIRTFGVNPFDGMTIKETEDKLIEFDPIVKAPVKYLNNIIGHIIIIPMTATQMLKHNAIATKKIMMAISKGFCYHDINFFGLGMFTSSVTGGGLRLSKHLKKEGNHLDNVFLTNGNALTASITVEGIKKITRQLGINIKNTKIGIVGATGSIGSAVSFLSTDLCDNILLVARNTRKLKALEEKLQGKNNLVRSSIDLMSLNDCDIVIVCTSDQGAIINERHLKCGAIVYDDTQPKNVDKSLIQKRRDVLVIDGAIVEAPDIKIGMDIGLGGSEGDSSLLYACLAETVILYLERKNNKHYSLGKVNLEQAQEMLNLFNKYSVNHGFKIAPFRSFNKIINPRQFLEHRKLINIAEIAS